MGWMRTRPAAVIASLAASSLPLTACGSSGHAHRSAHVPRPTHVIDRAHGISFDLARGWHRASMNLTPHLADPREVLSAGTFVPRYRRTACAQAPGSALEQLRAGGAFVTVQERGRGSAGGFPRRPKHFGPNLGGPADFHSCVPGAHYLDHWFAFAVGGRHFNVDVAFGPRASRVTQSQAWGLLDSLTVDPRVRPSWRSSP